MIEKYSGRLAEGDATVLAASLLLLGDRVVGVLDGVLSRLRAIEESLDSLADGDIDDSLRRIGNKLNDIVERIP